MAKGRRTLAIVAMIFANVLVAFGSATPAFAACTNATSGTSGSTKTVSFTTKDGISRSYILHVPTGLSATPKLPLVLSLHGSDVTSISGIVAAGRHETETGWDALAKAQKFIVAYPAAKGALPDLPVNWNPRRGSRDVTFLREALAKIATTRCVNLKKVYVEGYSLGGVMAERVACDAADKFAAVAAYAGGSPSAFVQGSTPCGPVSRHIAVGIFQSELDLISTPEIGRANRDEWIARNHCPATPIKETGAGVTGEAWAYRPCTGSTPTVEVDWRLYPGGSHNWPSGAPGVDIRARMWGLFSRNPLP